MYACVCVCVCVCVSSVSTYEQGIVSTIYKHLIEILLHLRVTDFPGGSDGKASVYNAGDPGSRPGLGRFPGEGNGNPLQYYCLENPMDRGAWQAAVYGVAKSQTRLSDFIHFKGERVGVE